jgi:sporulation protein YlmC with PRC-barrel domain
MKSVKIALFASVLAATPAASLAQEVGATIYGSDGSPVGTVAEITGDVVVIDTGTHKAPVPMAQLFDGEAGKSVNATKAQVDTMMAQQIAAANAQRDAALVEGAAVVSVGGTPVGTLGKVDLAADKIILEGEEGAVMVKKEAFAISPEGKLTVLYSADQIASTAAAAKAAPTGGAM